MKQGIIISIVIIFTLACGATNNFPTALPTNNRIATQTNTVPRSSTPSPTPQVEWRWGTALFNYFSFGTIANGRYNDYFSRSYDDDYNQINGTRVLRLHEYYYDEISAYFQNENKQINAINITNKIILWQSSMQGFIIGLGGNTVIVATNNNRIYALDKNNGQERWKIIVGMLLSNNENSAPYPFIQYNDGDIIIPMRSVCNQVTNVRFLHINEETGENWLTPCNYEWNSWFGALVAYSDGIFIATGRPAEGTFSSDFMFYGINPEDGSITWQFGDSYYLHGDEIINFDSTKNILYIQSVDRQISGNGKSELVALDATTGNKLWGNGIFEFNDIVQYQTFRQYAKFQLTEKYIFYHDNSNFLIFLKENGVLLTKISPEKTFFPFVSDSGVIMYYPDLGIAQGININTGDILWENDEFTPPLKEGPGDKEVKYYYNDFGDIIMMMDAKSRDIFATNIATGEELWRRKLYNYSLSMNNISNIILDDTDGESILFPEGSTNGINLWRLNPYSGEKVEFYNNPRIDINSNPIINIHQMEGNIWLIKYAEELVIFEVR